MAEKIPFGQAGKIYPPEFLTGRVGKNGNPLRDRWRARRRVHTLFGVLKEICAYGDTAEEAIEKLTIKTQKKLAMPGGSSLLWPTSLIRTVAEVLISDLEKETKRSSPRVKAGTVTNYERVYRNHIHPLMGEVKLNEAKPALCQAVVNEIADKMSEDAARKAATVLKQVFNTGAVRSAIGRVLKAANLQDIVFHPHKARKTVATLVWERSGYMENASRLLSHAVQGEHKITKGHYLEKRRNVAPNMNSHIESYISECSEFPICQT